MSSSSPTMIEKYPRNDLRYENIGKYSAEGYIFTCLRELGIYFMQSNNIQPTCHNFPTKLSQIYVCVYVECGAVSDLDAIRVYK